MEVPARPTPGLEQGVFIQGGSQAPLEASTKDGAWVKVPSLPSRLICRERDITKILLPHQKIFSILLTIPFFPPSLHQLPLICSLKRAGLLKQIVAFSVETREKAGRAEIALTLMGTALAQVSYRQAAR